MDYDDSDQRVIILSSPRMGTVNYTVNMSNFAFSPATIIINKGDSVTWVNHVDVNEKSGHLLVRN